MKHYVVLLDRSRLYPDWDGELPIPDFDHVWVEHPDTFAGECVAHLWRGTLGITHAAPITRSDLEGCHKLRLIVVTGPDPSCVDQAACAERGIEVAHLPVQQPAADHAAALIKLLENAVSHQ